MEPTRRLWGVGVLAIGGAILGVLFSSPLYLGIPLGIGAWILAHQIAFTRALSRLTDTPPVTQSLSRETILVGDTTLLTIQVTTGTDSLLDLEPTLTVQPSPALEVDGPRQHELTAEKQTLTVPLRVQVAGDYTVRPPQLQLTGRGGLFRESLDIGNACAVTGEPRVPRDTHIGTGGESIAVAYGEHGASYGGTGFDPGELREYLPGDPANRIDWKATARTGEPHVREFDPETTRQTQLLVDRRQSMRMGRAGETKQDYGREIAAWITEYVATLDDPLGLTFVSDEQITTVATPQASTAHYQRVRREILDLGAPAAQQSTADSNRDRPTRQSGGRPRLTLNLEDGLAEDDPFSRTLRPYVRDAAKRHRVADKPLLRAVQTLEAGHAETAWLVIVTDDAQRGELLETARLAATRDRFVTFFVLPSVLFEPPGAEISAAYDAYQDFESFRQQLATTTNVTAFEVGPRDRLGKLLESTHTRRAEQ